ncbi:hypothetical protein FRC01_000385 [Tulasnella sp. 417]|nr:hypothetical protein FRC01_000385 [Tulasnella sp. 417]
MKFLTLFIARLGFAPTILDHGLSAGYRAPAPTRVFPTKTYDPSYAFNAGKLVLQAPATSATKLHHNNAGESGPAVSISTASERVVAGTADTINFNPRRLQDHQSDLDHLQEIDSGWVVGGFHLFLTFLTVGTALVRERSSDQRRLHFGPVVKVSSPLEPRGTVEGPGIPIAAPTTPEKAHQVFSPRSSVEVPKTTGLADPCEGTVDKTVALKQSHRIIAWTTLFSVEGFLSLDPCSKTSDCGDAVKWAIVFHPQDTDCPTWSPAYLDAHGTINERLLNILFRGIPTHHLWATIRPLTHPQTVPDTELETSLESTPFKYLTGTYGIDTEEYNTRLLSVCNGDYLCSTSPYHEAQMSEPADQTVTGTYGIDTEDYNTLVPRPASAPPRLPPTHEASPADQAVTGSYGIDPEESNTPVPRPASAPPRLASSHEAGQRLQTRADVRMKSVEGHVKDQLRASETGEDGSAGHAQAENVPRTGNKRTKRGGTSEARRKRRLATKAVESPEAGPSGSN